MYMEYQKTTCDKCYEEKEIYRSIEKELDEYRDEMDGEEDYFNLLQEKKASLLELHQVKCVIFREDGHIFALCRKHVQFVLDGFKKPLKRKK